MSLLRFYHLITHKSLKVNYQLLLADFGSFILHRKSRLTVQTSEVLFAKSYIRPDRIDEGR